MVTQNGNQATTKTRMMTSKVKVKRRSSLRLFFSFLFKVVVSSRPARVVVAELAVAESVSVLTSGGAGTSGIRFRLMTEGDLEQGLGLTSDSVEAGSPPTGEFEVRLSQGLG